MRAYLFLSEDRGINDRIEGGGYICLAMTMSRFDFVSSVRTHEDRGSS